MSRLFINSLPKSGTHLVERAVRLLTGRDAAPLQLSSATASRYAVPDAGPTVLVGVGMPVQVPLAPLRAHLASLAADAVVTGHVPFSPAMDLLLRELGFGMILVLRDPRDVAVSLAHHITTNPSHRLHQHFQSLSWDQRLSATIQGVPGLLEDSGRRLASVIRWLGLPYVLPIRFEDLVGSKGGGDDARQRQALQAIATHLNLPCPIPLDQAQAQLFGHSATFRKGTVGQWRDQLSAHQIRQIRDLCPIDLCD